MIVAYRQQRNPTVLVELALHYLNAQIEEQPVEETLATFEDEFPAMPIYRGQQTVDEFLVAETG